MRDRVKQTDTETDREMAAYFIVGHKQPSD